MNRYRIAVALDDSEYAEIVLEHALDQAARHEAPEMHFLYVKEKKQRKRATEEMQQRLSAVVYPALQTFNRFGTDWRARLHVRAGKPDEQISSLAQDLQADLIVIGQFGLHTRGESLKTLPSRVLQAAPCPTLVVGMPHALQQPMCFACARVREETEARNWFCDDHRADERVDHGVTPMTVWTGGSLMW
jgi:nucleotide-binding universal stress UspA family protein